MAFFGLVLALFLLFSLGFFYWAPLVFPLWVLLISVHILVANLWAIIAHRGSKTLFDDSLPHVIPE